MDDQAPFGWGGPAQPGQQQPLFSDQQVADFLRRLLIAGTGGYNDQPINKPQLPAGTLTTDPKTGQLTVGPNLTQAFMDAYRKLHNLTPDQDLMQRNEQRQLTPFWI